MNKFIQKNQNQIEKAGSYIFKPVSNFEHKILGLVFRTQKCKEIEIRSKKQLLIIRELQENLLKGKTSLYADPSILLIVPKKLQQ